MKVVWAARLPSSTWNAAAVLRLEPGVEVLEADGSFWLRGAALDERLDLMLRKVPGIERFAVLADGQLVPDGRHLPQGRLPSGTWMPLTRWLSVELPVAALGAAGLERIPVACERVSAIEEPNVLLTSLAQWRAFGDRAPQVRLARLTFAAASDGRVIVRGVPLPPIAGERYYERAGIALPCGWGWPGWLDFDTVRAALDLPAGDLALFSDSGRWESIAAEHFVQAGRSAIRLSCSAAEG